MRISRRQFLVASTAAAGSVVVAGGGVMYAKFKNIDLFGLYVESIQEVLTVHFGGELTETILKGTWQEYQTLLPEVPDIGGEKNPNAENLLVATYCLAVFRVLKARGQTTEQAGRIIYEAFGATVDLPGWLRGVAGRLKYGKKNEERWREHAAESQEHQYPGDWVFTFVEGDGEGFDYGLDITECGICKLYHAQGADDLAPYMCLSDYVVSRAFDRGLVRYKTLAEGAEKCDFRYKKGRETFVYPLRDGWPPRFLSQDERRS
jgi:hypothetical protein